MNLKPASIVIGGAITRETLALLLSAISDDSPVYNADNERVTEEGVCAHASEGQRPLQLVADDAADGAFPHVEAVCVAHGLTFRRTSEANFGSTAEIAAFTPPMQEPASAGLDDGDGVMVPLATIKAAAERGGDLQALVAQYEVFATVVPPLKLEVPAVLA